MVFFDGRVVLSFTLLAPPHTFWKTIIYLFTGLLLLGVNLAKILLFSKVTFAALFDTTWLDCFAMWTLPNLRSKFRAAIIRGGFTLGRLFGARLIHFNFDLLKDVIELAEVVLHAHSAPVALVTHLVDALAFPTAPIRLKLSFAFFSFGRFSLLGWSTPSLHFCQFRVRIFYG